MCQTVFTQYDPSESWYTEQKDVWLDDTKTFYNRPMRCVIVVQLCWRSLLISRVQKNMHRRFTSFSRRVQGQACHIEQVTEGRNIQQHSIHPRSESSHVEFVDQHYPARLNNYVRGDSSG